MNINKVIRKLVAKGRLHPVVVTRKVTPEKDGDPTEVREVVAVGRKPRSRKARQFFMLKAPVLVEKFDIKTHFGV